MLSTKLSSTDKHMFEATSLQYGTFGTLLAVVFVLTNAFFVAAEFALVKVRITRLELLARKGNPLAKLAQKMAHHLDEYLSATQLGITLASLGLGWIGEPAFAVLIEPVFQFFNLSLSPAAYHSLSFTLAFGTMSALHIIVGELIPKSIAIQSAEWVVLWIALPLRVFYVIFFPFLWVLNAISNLILKLFRSKLSKLPGRAHSEEELKLIVEDSMEEGVILPNKKLLLDKAFDFSHKRVSDIMILSDKMVCFYQSRSIHENMLEAMDSGHSRFPLFDKAGGQVLGFIHMKDVVWNLENPEVINLFDLRRRPLYFAPDARLDHALKEFQRSKIHIGFVKNSQGQVLGLLTLEDVIEQLVGAIDDEFDIGPEV